MFSEEIKKLPSWQELEVQINSKTQEDVIRALNSKKLSLEDFKALVSPAAEAHLEQMAQLSKTATQKRFGKTIQFYIPLYLSNECTNHCIYCGFNHNNKVERIVLNDEELLKEVKVIKDMGYEHILLLTGEDTKKTGVDYIEHAMQLIKPYFAQVSLEVAPMSSEDYLRLRKACLHAVYIYQETYNKEKYRHYHPAGLKRDYDWRINTPDRLGEAGVHTIGLGALLGLENWRVEAYCMAVHLNYLRKKYWKTKYAVSFPRIRPHEGGFQADNIVGDKEFVQMMWAFRLFDNDLEMSLTTRESEHFRNNMISLGITSISAGSKTDPGGYSLQEDKELPQFVVNDSRSPEKMRKMIEERGYTVIWKNWDTSLN